MEFDRAHYVIAEVLKNQGYAVFKLPPIIVNMIPLKWLGNYVRPLHAVFYWPISLLPQ